MCKFCTSALVMLVQPAVSSVPAGETLATLNIKWLANLSVIVMTRMRRRIDVMTRMGKVIIAMSEFIVKPKEDCGGEVYYCHIQLEGGGRVRFCDTFLFSSGLRTTFHF